MKAKIDHLEMEFHDFGAGPAVLCLHDSPVDGGLAQDVFRPLIEAGYRVVTTRLIGLGETPAEEGFDPTPHARHAIALLNYLGIGRAVVLGIGLGGYVLAELLERFPGRIAASSLVVGAAAAGKIRKGARRADIRRALREGRPEEIKRFLAAALPTEPGERTSYPALGQLRAWVGRVRSRTVMAGNRKDFATLLAEIDVPPLLVEEANSVRFGRTPAPSLSIAARGWRKIKGINTHLLALLDTLWPKEEEVDEEDILTGMS